LAEIRFCNLFGQKRRNIFFAGKTLLCHLLRFPDFAYFRQKKVDQQKICGGKKMLTLLKTFFFFLSVFRHLLLILKKTFDSTFILSEICSFSENRFSEKYLIVKQCKLAHLQSLGFSNNKAAIKIPNKKTKNLIK
jgi:hypothetical protein